MFFDTKKSFKLSKFSSILNFPTSILTNLMKHKISLLICMITSLLSSNILHGQLSCDTLVLKSGKEILIQNFEMNSNDVRYERCEESEKSYILDKKSFKAIKYNNQSSLKDTSNNEFYVTIILEQNVIKGTLHDFRDSSILVKSSIFDSSRTPKEFQISSIQNLEIRKKGKLKKSIGRCTIAGFIIGFTTGQIIKKRSERKSSMSTSPFLIDLDIPENAPVYIFSTIGALSGAIVGTALGMIKVNIPINGKIENYQKAKRRFKFFF